MLTTILVASFLATTLASLLVAPLLLCSSCPRFAPQDVPKILWRLETAAVNVIVRRSASHDLLKAGAQRNAAHPSVLHAVHDVEQLFVFLAVVMMIVVVVIVVGGSRCREQRRWRRRIWIGCESVGWFRRVVGLWGRHCWRIDPRHETLSNCLGSASGLILRFTTCYCYGWWRRDCESGKLGE